MQIFNPAQNNLALDVYMPILVDAVLPSTVNVTIPTILDISPTCAEDPTWVDDQPLLTSAENPEIGPADLAAREDQASHLAGEGRHTEATLTTPGTSAPVAVPHRTIAEEDPPDVENAVPHHTGTRSATLCLLIPIMKVNFIQIRHLMAKGPSTPYHN